MAIALEYDKCSSSKSRLGEWHRIKTSSLPYFTMYDIKKIYKVLNNLSTKGFKDFEVKSREIAVTIPNGKNQFYYQFRNEAALFNFFKEALPIQLEQKGIDCWGRLMQYIS